MYISLCLWKKTIYYQILNHQKLNLFLKEIIFKRGQYKLGFGRQLRQSCITAIHKQTFWCECLLACTSSPHCFQSLPVSWKVSLLSSSAILFSIFLFVGPLPIVGDQNWIDNAFQIRKPYPPSNRHLEETNLVQTVQFVWGGE